MDFEIPTQYKNGSGIYSLTNKLNGKRLIGSTNNFEHRFGVYKCALNKGNYKSPYIQRAFKKYGTDAFRFELVNICNESDLLDVEDYYIRAFDSMNCSRGYNLQTASRTTMTEEMKKKISEALIGKKKSENHCKNISKSKMGIKLSEEAKTKISQWRMGKYTQPLRPVYQYSLDGKLVNKFTCAKEAAKFISNLGYSKNCAVNISSALRCKRNPIQYRFKWSYS